ncbi:hypothetical protein [Vandammella animalimorsus]|uniref:SMI1/KNR4 family protein n=1 Tax=Vandammella animalimorsus TaxID=2029117 RepID=A0A2A2A8M2_9BURK|nr:hypothetical protein [Vandammella animalimorsus]PAT34122.1 hypothetical protein CK620_10775 [Vandammella animalimorsus]
MEQPSSSPTVRLDEAALRAIASAYPGLAADYLAYLRDTGWGESASGCMIYSAPVPAHEIYGPDAALGGKLLLGDDFQGHCLGYDLQARCYGEVSPEGLWQPWPADQGLASYVA